MPDARIEERSRSMPNPALAAMDADWRETLPEEWTAPGRDLAGKEIQIPLRRHPALAKYASKNEAIKALVHAQRLLGKKGEGESSLLGLAKDRAQPPASPADYDLPQLDMPEDFRIDEALRDAFLEKAHELGLTGDQVAGLYAWFLPLNVQALLERHEQDNDERLRQRESQLAALRKVHGGAAQSVLGAARKAVLALGGGELMERLEACGAADDARVVQAFARVAPLVSETGKRARDAAPAQGLTPQRLREMLRDPRYHDPSRRDPDFVRQVSEGFDALYPGTRGQEGRREGM
ncbi:hypothetical protein SAMN04488503_1618 [Humidesulfovibrio mexicanus]|uniref:Uncharacterized protein n=1 Tax=Humidesulfovibrio mexicanus TaxID=147047 RepID=A0A238ZU86_9BACT|nr:hypothetical protein [Humidesulfovibrio mexicanus]SNR86987.1 hypothetical protein SAMN04488503_1618 [Humidesulfovibrio mexicanus]